MSARLVALDEFLARRLIHLERDELTAEMCGSDAWVRRILQYPALSFAMLDGGEVIGGGGLVPMWSGRAEAWQLSSRFARPRQLVAGVKLARAWLDQRQRDPVFRRVEAFVRKDHKWAFSFIDALGFVREGVLRNWDPRGRDVWICARIAELG